MTDHCYVLVHIRLIRCYGKKYAGELKTSITQCIFYVSGLSLCSNFLIRFQMVSYLSSSLSVNRITFQHSWIMLINCLLWEFIEVHTTRISIQLSSNSFRMIILFLMSTQVRSACNKRVTRTVNTNSMIWPNTVLRVGHTDMLGRILFYQVTVHLGMLYSV